MKSQLPQAVEVCHDLLKWMIPQLDKMPRSRRFTLGLHMEQSLLAILENLVSASYNQNKKQFLSIANQKIGLVQHLWRLCMELKLISMKKYHFGTSLIIDLGKQTGGWLKSLKA